MPDERIDYYETTPLVRTERNALKLDDTHWRLTPNRLTGQITARLRTLQLLHVGNGQLIPPRQSSDAPLVKAFHRVEDRPTIPGSSLKGAIRSLIEAFTPSCVNKTGDFQIRKNRDYAECSYQQKDRHNQKKPYHQQRLCPACQLFGAMGFLGRVQIQDAPLIKGQMKVHDIPAQFPPKAEDARRHYPHDLSSPKERIWPIEAAATGSLFSFTLTYQNLSPADLGLLLLALGEGESPMRLKLGGGKSSGLGSVQFDELVVRSLPITPSYLNYDLADWQIVDKTACLESALSPDGLVLKDILQQLQEMLAWTETGAHDD